MPDEALVTAVSPARDLLVVNARAHTGDPRRPWADAVLVRDGILVALGSSAELRKRAGAAALVIDARGLLALSRTPGDVLRAGAAADLVLVERTEGAPAGDEGVVFELERGRIVHDRLGLAGERAP
jgi:cytosine/adenosine deaminase-related metal-dependent hydrolase